jgi:glycosyltransferase involved in cell wall biosynthesis
MKIIHVVYGLTWGGIETMLLNIANEQVKSNDVSIIVFNDLIEQSLIDKFNKKIKLYLIKRKVSSLNPFYPIKLIYLLFKLTPDIIHLHDSSILKFLPIPSIIIKKKLCATQHDVCLPLVAQTKYLHKCNKLFAISNVVKEDILRVEKLDSEVILNGIKPELIKKRESLINNGKIFKIVQLGRLMHQKKGQHILIEALKILEERGIHTVQLFFIGEGESEEYLKNCVTQYHLEDKVFFLGSKTQDFIFQNLHLYDLLVQPSIYEGFGLTVAEGMAAKIPVLVSENQGPLEITGYGQFGYYFENGNPQSCAGMILKIMNDPNRIPMVEKAYKRVCELYNVENTANNYLKKYNEMLSDK